MTLPAPDPDALAASQRLLRLIAAEIDTAGGWISFAHYMNLALYAPGLGYYSGGARKFGAAGDFVTAPQMTGLFGQALASQLAQIQRLSAPQIIEAGAGSGRLAADLLAELERLDATPERYRIIELSGELRARQKQTIESAVPHLSSRVEWLDRLPEKFSGVLFGNEVLDAMPAHLVTWYQDAPAERGVTIGADGRLQWAERPASGAILAAAQSLAGECRPADGYSLELALAARAWLAEWGRRLEIGAVLLIDYGFPCREYYHPQRREGTLMCHYRHRAHGDPFFLPGLQDITTHVDFTAVAEALHDAGLDILGYTAQAPFLMNCGLLDRLSRFEPTAPETIRENAAVQKLLSPAEMGELFKVIAAGRGIAEPLLGFARADRLHAL